MWAVFRFGHFDLSTFVLRSIIQNEVYVVLCYYKPLPFHVQCPHGLWMTPTLEHSQYIHFIHYSRQSILLYFNFLHTFRLIASANSPAVVELIVELIGELFIVELLYCNYLEFLKACFKIIYYKNTVDNIFNWNMPFENPKNCNSIILLWIIRLSILLLILLR